MQFSRLSWLSLLLLVAGVGCVADVPPPPPQEPPAMTEDGELIEPDAPSTNEMFQRMGVATKVNEHGVIVELDFRKIKTDDTSLRPIDELQGLQAILVTGETLTDQGLRYLGSQSRSLRTLDLRDCSITNEGMKRIAQLSKLRALRLSGKSGACTVDDAGLEAIAELTELRALSLDYLWVSEVGLAHLAKLQNLEELNLAKTLVGDDALALLVQFPKLKKLRISQCQVTSEGLAQLAKITTLEDLDLSENSQVFDTGMESVGQLTKLKKLNLWRVPLTDAGVASLAPLTNLEWLNLDNTQLSDQGLDHLAGMTKLTFLHLGSTSISDAGVGKLAGLTALKDLKVTRTAVSQSGVTVLQKALPNTTIQLEYIEQP